MHEKQICGARVMMATENLLDINVDTLFEQYSVSEIDQIHKNLKSSIEEKKEELRMMVG